MTNIDRAADIVREHSFSRRPDDVAQALANAGLLTPDLPEPVWRPHAEHPHRYHAWPIPSGQVERNTSRGALISITDTDGEDIRTYTQAEAKEVAYALISAADYGDPHETTEGTEGTEGTDESDAPGISEESASESGNSQVGGAIYGPRELRYEYGVVVPASGFEQWFTDPDLAREDYARGAGIPERTGALLVRRIVSAAEVIEGE